MYKGKILFSTASDPFRISFKKNKVLQIFSFMFFCMWCWTLIDVVDMTNWSLENIPVFVSVFFLVWFYKRYQLSDLSYILILLFLSMHIFGAKYTYAENPFGMWLKDLFNSDRNHYDRLVHFCFGFFISYPIREMFLYYFGLSQRLTLGLCMICSMAAGAFYEIVEMIIVSLFFPEQGQNFLGIQGDIWDPQKDILLALMGSIFFCILIMIKSRRIFQRVFFPRNK